MAQTTTQAGFGIHSVHLADLGGAVVASVRGKVDYSNAADLRRHLVKILALKPEGAVVLELGSVESMDTAAAAVLVEILMEGHRRDLKVFLCGSSPEVRRRFELAGLDEALDCCCDSRDEVRRRLGEQGDP